MNEATAANEKKVTVKNESGFLTPHSFMLFSGVKVLEGTV